jgi:hypothetical protein
LDLIAGRFDLSDEPFDLLVKRVDELVRKLI